MMVAQSINYWNSRRHRKFVMGDIHGGVKALAQVLERCEFDYERDTLIQLGDVADGWSNTYECVQILLQVKNLIAIRGNHDETFNQWLKTGSHPYNWDQGAHETLKSYCNAIGFELKSHKTVIDDGMGGKITQYLVNAIPEIIPQEHVDFFRKQIKYYIDDDNNIFVHAGFDRQFPFKEQDESIYYWDRKLWKQALSSRSSQTDMKFADESIGEIFIGHTTTTAWGIDHPIKADRVWNMDTGAGFNGRLSIMEVNTKELWQSDLLPELYPEEMGRYEPRKTKKL